MGTRGGIDERPEAQGSWEVARENIRGGSLPEGIETVKDARYVNDITQVLHAFDQNIRKGAKRDVAAFDHYKADGTTVTNSDIDLKNIGEGSFG